MVGQLLTTNQSENIIISAVYFIGNVLVEKENPDLGQQVLKHTQILDFLSQLTVQPLQNVCNLVPWLVQSTLYHVHFGSDAELVSEDPVNICIRLLSTTLNLKKWRSEEDPYQVTLRIISDMIRENPTATTKLVMFYFDVLDLCSPALQSQDTGCVTNCLEILGSLLQSDEVKIARKVKSLFPDLEHIVYHNFAMHFLLAIRHNELVSEEEGVLLKVALWMLGNYFSDQIAADEFLADPNRINDFLEGAEELAINPLF